jgi:6,7-dimethyl-8-ribityllumazine synthase
MSKQRPDWSARTGRHATEARGLRFAVIVARFNSQVTEKLLDGAREAFHARKAGFDEFFVPGAFELPLAAKLLARTGKYHGVVALGAVIRGETPHFDFVAGEAARGLQQVALETGVPVAFGVLTTNTTRQATARAGGLGNKRKTGNKGYDAAMTAIEMANFPGRKSRGAL